jgi:rSAM/selenodomain-associated transferase 2
MRFVSVVIPVFRDRDALARVLRGGRLGETQVQVIVAFTRQDREELAQLRAEFPGVSWMEAPRGRARQMNAGAAIACGKWLLFLHADTQLPAAWGEAMIAADRDPATVHGCFRFSLDSPSLMARAIESGVSVRVRVLALPYGDQALFVRRDVFESLGGYADLPIMEDVDLVRRLNRRGRLYRSAAPVLTSARRWERDGWIRRTLRHLTLISLYFVGIPPSQLIRLDSTRARPEHPEYSDPRMFL